MKKTLNHIILVASILALSACATHFRSDVTTFHKLSAPGGERVVLTPMNPEKQDSLEYRQYADILANELGSYGYKETGENEPELIAGFDVTINDGREKLSVRPGFNGFPYWRSGFWAYGRFWRSPFYRGRFSPFDDDELVARTVYLATLRFELRKPDGTVVFEGHAETETRRKDLPRIMPLLAEALFENFPGNNGETRRVILERDKK